MAGKKRKLKSLAETVTENERMTVQEKKEKLELQGWSDLPAELLESITSSLTLDDNVHASVFARDGTQLQSLSG